MVAGADLVLGNRFPGILKGSWIGCCCSGLCGVESQRGVIQNNCTAGFLASYMLI